jgi:hypothetical protein
MSRILRIVLTAIGLSLFTTPAIVAAHESELTKAISHTREAVVAGREGKPSALVLHATEALHHAEAAQRERPNYHINAGVNRLREAIKYGKAKRGAATKIAYRALQELERAPH